MAERAVPVDVRASIASWPADAPRGAVTQFCREHQLSRSQFYEIRSRARSGGLAAALAPRSRAPRHNPRAISDDLVDLAVRVRKQLEDDGWDCGPLSVAAAMRRLGARPPAPATLAAIFRRRGMVVPSPHKRPRSSYRRFTFPAPNACWQLDGFEWPLLDGTTAVVLQVEDDHSRRVLASLAAPGETSAAVCAVIALAQSRFGTPQAVLTDNGTALNVSRRGRTNQLQVLLASWGTKAIAARPHHPQTCGKNERLHQTVQRWLRRQARAASLAELQDQLAVFDRHYNAVRPHQGLDLRTPLQVWQATALAAPPIPPALEVKPALSRGGVSVTTPKVGANGSAGVGKISVQLGWQLRGQRVIAAYDRPAARIDFFDSTGTHVRAVTVEPGRMHYPSGRPRGGSLRYRRYGPQQP